MIYRFSLSLLILLLRLSQIGADLVCPYDFTFFNNKCYHIGVDPSTSLTARMLCERMSSELVSIHSDEEAQFIVSSHDGRESWLGLFCNGWDENWEWLDGSKIDYVNFVDNTSNTENCLEVPSSERFVLKDDLQWYKREMGDSRNFTCVRMPINCPENFEFLTDSWCFQSNTTAMMDYGNATIYCEGLGAELPSVESDEVSNALVMALAIEQPVKDANVWIGLECARADTTWYWSNQVPYWPSQAHFAEQISNTTCQPYAETKYALNTQGKWASVKYNKQLPYTICTTRALAMPTETPDITRCPEGYKKFFGASPDEDWCFALNHPLPLGNTSNFEAAKRFCEDRGETLPIVTSSAMTIFLRSIRASFDFLVRRTNFWIALECAQDGAYKWTDGTPLDEGYAPWFGNSESRCDDFYRTVFNSDGKWSQLPAEVGQSLIVCAVRATDSTAEPVFPTQPGTATLIRLFH